MPPLNLTQRDEDLVKEVIATFLQGRGYPSSHSDMHAGLVAVLRMYEITRRLAPYDPTLKP